MDVLEEGFGVGHEDSISNDHLGVVRHGDDWAVFATREEAEAFLATIAPSRRCFIRRVRRQSAPARPLFEIIQGPQKGHVCQLPPPVRGESGSLTTWRCPDLLCQILYVLVQAGPKSEDNPRGETWVTQSDFDQRQNARVAAVHRRYGNYNQNAPLHITPSDFKKIVGS